MTSRKQELRRQLRVVRRNPNLIATLFLLQTGLLQINDDLDFAAARQLYREQARLRTRHLAAQARKLHPPTSKSVILTLSKAKGKDLQVASVTDIASRERPKEANLSDRAAGASARAASTAVHCLREETVLP